MDNEAENQAHGESLAAPDVRLTATAFHEAGHTVMALILGRPIQRVTIKAGQMPIGGARLGLCEIKKGRSKGSKDGLEDDALIMLAGMVAEARFTGQYCHAGATQDLQVARRLLGSRANSPRQLEKLERRALDKTEHLLGHDGHARAIELIADELVQKTTISGRAAEHLFHQALRQSSR